MSPDDVAKLEYRDGVVKETLRLNPVIPDVMRLVKRPVRIGGLDLPAGIGVAPNIYAAHRRPDVWPTGDFGVRKGLARIHGREDPLSPKEMGPLGDAYRPWRSAAAWYCWRTLEIELPQIG